MKKHEIKKEVDKMYEQISSAEKRLKQLRAICTHTEHKECNYSWRPGVIQKADICSFCGEFIRYTDDYLSDIKFAKATDDSFDGNKTKNT